MVSELVGNGVDTACEFLEEGTEKENIDSATFWISHPLIILAEAYRVVCKTELAKETISRALNISKSREERVLEAWAMPVLAGINADIGQIEDAAECYMGGIKQSSALHMLPLKANCHLGLGELFLKIGSYTKARDEINVAIGLYRSMGTSFWLPKAEAVLTNMNFQDR